MFYVYGKKSSVKEKQKEERIEKMCNQLMVQVSKYAYIINHNLPQDVNRIQTKIKFEWKRLTEEVKKTFNFSSHGYFVIFPAPNLSFFNMQI
jgi:hypothetical protein